MNRIFSALILLVVFLFGCEQSPEPIDIIQLDAGKVFGSRSEDGEVLVVKGIPYAEPPVGDLRWKAPEAVQPWTGTMACTAFAASAMQPAPVPFLMYTSEYLIPEEPISEDCLYLNVWTAATSKEERRPVLVWIHGGGFTTGGAACPIYDGEDLARKGIVFVSINYRVGLMGFFAHPDLSSESRFLASGNYGMLDQIEALKWVQRNIEQFGGDPDQVTIAGQSAGSAAVHVLVASPIAKGLFHRAIGESGSPLMRPHFPLSEAEAWGVEAWNEAGISDLSAARSLPADSLMKLLGNQFSPAQDGYVLPKPVNELMSEGQYNDVPTLLGWNADEGLMFGPPQPAEAYRSSVMEQYGEEQTELLLHMYPASTDAVAAESQKRLSTHRMFAIPTLRWAELQGKFGEESAFLYHFDRTPPGPKVFTREKAHHTAEVPYVLSTLEQLNRPWESVDLKLESLMSDYWVNFVKNGNPNVDDLSVWVEFEAGDPLAMKFSTVGEEIMTGMGPIPDLKSIQVLRSVQQD